MDDHTTRASDDPAHGDGREAVGSLGEETAKLLAAAAAWAREQQEEAHEDDAHRDGAPCTWCPICQCATFLRSASPELGAAVRGSVVSLTELARTVLDSLADHQRHAQPGRDEGRRASDGAARSDVEHIDLARDPNGDDAEGDDAWD